MGLADEATSGEVLGHLGECQLIRRQKRVGEPCKEGHVPGPALLLPSQEGRGQGEGVAPDFRGIPQGDGEESAVHASRKGHPSAA